MNAKGNCNTFALTLAMGGVLVLLFYLLASAAAAPMGSAFTYQGRLIDSAGPISGRYDFLFRLYSVPSGGSALINITNADVSVSNGVFTTAIDFGPVFTSDARWLEIRFRTNASSGFFTTLSPRQPLMAIPHAHFATLAGNIPDRSIDAQKISARPAANGDVLAYSDANLIWTNVVTQDYWKLLGNTGTTEGVHFLGTTDNQPLELKVNGKRVFRMVPTSNAPTIIGGFAGNFATTDAVGITISGGGAENISHIVNTVDYWDWTLEHLIPIFASIGGGAANRIEGAAYSTVAGGLGNHVGAYRIGEGHQSVITGGENNGIGLAAYSSITGGQENHISGESAYRIRYSTIGGGGNNIMERAGWFDTIRGGGQHRISLEPDFVTIGGGRANSVARFDAEAATIGGGAGNYAYGRSGTIGGGSGNLILPYMATIGGGTRNYMPSQSYAATIAGGSGNSIKGDYGIIPGGRDNFALGSCFAAGRRANATHTGAFAWTDASDFGFRSLAPNEFCVRATGGVRLVTAIDDIGAPLAGAALASASGSWSSLSDRAAKENFVPANPADILDKVAGLPLSTWNYKAQDKSIRHIGPTAQDFHDAFGVGENDRTISTIDADGVALAAIQALNQKLNESEARTCELEQRLIALEAALNRRGK